MADVAVTWLGHGSFRLDSPEGKRVYVDPFLKGNPKCPESEQEPERVDVIALTHAHGDHLGDTVDLAKQHGSTVVAPVELAAWLQSKHGLKNVLMIASSYSRRLAGVSGTIVTVAGTGVSGYTGDGGPATAARLSIPMGVALDAAGNLYIADFFNSTVRKIAAGTGVIAWLCQSVPASVIAASLVGTPSTVTEMRGAQSARAARTHSVSWSAPCGTFTISEALSVGSSSKRRRLSALVMAAGAVDASVAGAVAPDESVAGTLSAGVSFAGCGEATGAVVAGFGVAKFLGQPVLPRQLTMTSVKGRCQRIGGRRGDLLYQAVARSKS